METSKVVMEIEKPVASIFLNNPRRLNAITPGMVEEILHAVRDLEENPGIRVVVLRGKGGNFSAGADLSELEKFGFNEALKFHRNMNEIIYLMSRSSKIFIAAFEGYALGGGFELSLSADMRISTRNAVLGQPEINIGINAGAGGNAILPRIVGKGNAMYMALSGEKMSAQRALDLGIVQKIVEEGKLEEGIRELCDKIISHPCVSIQLSKVAINASQESSPQDSLNVEALVFSILNGNEEVKEKIRGFLSKKR